MVPVRDLRGLESFPGLLGTFFHTLIGTVNDVIPIAAIIFGFQLFVLRKPIPNLGRVLRGFLFVLLGLALFLDGLELALFPLGKLMATQLTDPEFIAGITRGFTNEPTSI